MHNLHPLSLAAQPCGKLFRDENRPMTAAGAADSDCQIALSLGDIARQEGMKQPRKRVQERRVLLIVANEARNLLIAASEQLKVRLIVGIGKETHIKHQIRLAWEARAERE